MCWKWYIENKQAESWLVNGTKITDSLDWNRFKVPHKKRSIWIVFVESKPWNLCFALVEMVRAIAFGQNVLHYDQSITQRSLPTLSLSASTPIYLLCFFCRKFAIYFKLFDWKKTKEWLFCFIFSFLTFKNIDLIDLITFISFRTLSDILSIRTVYSISRSQHHDKNRMLQIE